MPSTKVNRISAYVTSTNGTITYFLREAILTSIELSFIDTSNTNKGSSNLETYLKTLTYNQTGQNGWDHFKNAVEKYDSYIIATPITTSSDEASVDAFSRFRVSNPQTILDSVLQYDKQPHLWGESVSGAGASSVHLPNESSIKLTVGTVSGEKVYRQTHKYIPYQPGKSQEIMQAGVIGNSKTNVTQRIGYFDDNNGLFFEQSGNNGFCVVKRSYTSGSVVDTKITQSNFNIDKLDGTGASGFNIDFTKTQIFFIDFEWLGVGRIRYGIVYEGSVIYCHEIINANIQTEVYMTTANLPLRVEIENTGTTASATEFKQICSTVISEGGLEIPEGHRHSTNTGTTPVSVTTRKPILTIRPKLLFKGQTNRGIAIISNFHFLNSSNNVFFEVVRGGTLVGSSWVDNGTDSITEYDLSATSISGGDVIESGYVPSASGQKAVMHFGDISISMIIGGLSLKFDGTNDDIYTFVATSMSGTANVSVSVIWDEIH